MMKSFFGIHDKHNETPIPIGEIYKTCDYDLFKIFPYNRSIKERHLHALIDRIKHKNRLDIHPILVTSDYEVIDGQHRLSAAKALKLPIYYIVDYDYEIKDLICIQTNRVGWSTADFIHYYIQIGKKDYEDFEILRDKVGLTIRILLLWIGSTTHKGTKHIGTYSTFKNGDYRYCVDNTQLRALDTMSKFIKLMKDNNFRPNRIYEDNHFHFACKNFLCSPYINHEEFLEKVKNYHNIMRFSGSTYEYLKCLAELYNYHRQKGKVMVFEHNSKVSALE